MNLLASECSSGCESGWTLYFEHSMNDGDAPFLDENRAALFGIEGTTKRASADEVDEDEEEEEDLSMVSDASSGPPHLPEEEEEEDSHLRRFNSNGGIRRFGRTECSVPETEYSVSMRCKSSSKRKKKVSGDRDPDPSVLDDTASSSFINFFPTEEFMLTNNANQLDSVLEYPHGFSTTNFEGNSAFQQHQLGISQPSFSSHQFQNNQRSGRKRMEFR